MLLSKYGWHPREGFTSTLDLAGFKGALQKFKYIKVGQLGRGSYGVVYKAINRETHEVIAIKKVMHSVDHGLSDSTIREISALRELRHDNIVKLKDIITTVNGSNVHLVLECLDCDLRHYLDTSTEASDLRRIKVCHAQRTWPLARPQSAGQDTVLPGTVCHAAGGVN